MRLLAYMTIVEAIRMYKDKQRVLMRAVL